MNKKEANEIKKLFTPAGCAITRICGCYVDAEKNKKTELKQAFLSLQEEEATLQQIDSFLLAGVALPREFHLEYAWGHRRPADRGAARVRGVTR